MENPLKNLIEIIKTGTREEVKEAQKQVEKFWHRVYIPKRKEGREALSVFLEEIKKLDKIADIDHKSYFINTLKWPLWSVGEEHFEKWADFILKYIQHPSGKIRQAIIKAAEYLVIDIIPDLRFDSDKEISQPDEARIEKNKNRFCQFMENVENLFEKYYEPRFRRYKYISSLPPSIYKSLEILWVNLFHYKGLENVYLEYKYAKQKSEPEKFNISGLKLPPEEKEWDYYYDAMEYLNMGDTRMAEFLLKKAIAIDKDFVAGYVGLTAVAKKEKDRKNLTP